MNIKPFKVNLVDEGDRGAILETVITRMKIIPKFVNIIN